MTQRVTVLPAVLTPLWAPVPVLAALLPAWLPVNTPGKQKMTKCLAPAPMWDPGFDLAQSRTLQSFGE